MLKRYNGHQAQYCCGVSARRDDQSTYGREGVSCMSFSLTSPFDGFIKLTTARRFQWKIITFEKHLFHLFIASPCHHYNFISLSARYMFLPSCLLICTNSSFEKKKWIRCYIKVLLRICCWISRSTRERKNKVYNLLIFNGIGRGELH